MAMFHRLSTSIWSLVSPGKPHDETRATPQTAPQLPRHASQSLSPIARVAPAKVEQAAVRVGQKRKMMHTPSMRSGGRRKVLKMEDGDVAWDESEEEAAGVEESTAVDDDGDDDGNDDDDDDDDDDSSDNNNNTDEDASQLYEEADEDGMLGIEFDLDNIHVRSPSRSRSISTSPDPHAFEDDLDQDTASLDSDKPPSPGRGRRQAIDLPAEPDARGLSAADLRAQGWPDDHVLLVHKLARRGYEPLLPAHFKMDYPYLPDTLFAATDAAFIASTTAAHLRAIKALNALFEIGGRVRDRIICGGQLTPELQAQKSLAAYCAWADADARLDARTVPPLLTTVATPAGTDDAATQAAIHRRMARLHHRSEAALRSSAVPQVYGIVCTAHLLLALVAHRPDDPETPVRVVAAWDLRDRDADVWNALALAILICHLRNVRVRVAREAGLGVASAGAGEEAGADDEDL